MVLHCLQEIRAWRGGQGQDELAALAHGNAFAAGRFSSRDMVPRETLPQSGGGGGGIKTSRTGPSRAPSWRRVSAAPPGAAADWEPMLRQLGVERCVAAAHEKKTHRAVAGWVWGFRQSPANRWNRLFGPALLSTKTKPHFRRCE